MSAAAKWHICRPAPQLSRRQDSEIINNSTSSSSVTYEDHSTFSPTISITLGGETTKADAEEIVRRVKQAMEDFWQEKKEEEYHERTLQGAYAQ